MSKITGCYKEMSSNRSNIRHASGQTIEITRKDNLRFQHGCQDDIDSNKILLPPRRGRADCYALNRRYIFISLMRPSCIYSQTDGTSQRQTPRTLSRTPITPDTPDSLELGVHEFSSDNEEEPTKKTRVSIPWNVQENLTKRSRYI